MPQMQTLGLLTKRKRLYLGLKMEKIGAGALNAPGGKWEPIDGDDPKKTTKRELKQECGIKVELADLRQVALLHISREGKGHEIDLHVHMASRFVGVPFATKEMGLIRPYAFDEIDYGLLMPADHLWLPDVLAGLTLEAWFTYDHKRTKVLDYKSIIKSFD